MMKFSRTEIQALLIEEIAAETKCTRDQLDTKAHFAAQGLDSLNCIYVLYQLEKKLDKELNPAIFWDFPTIELLADHLHQTTQDQHG